MSEEKKSNQSVSPAVLFGISAMVVIIIGLIIAVVILAGRNQKLQNGGGDSTGAQTTGEAVPGSDSLQAETSDNGSTTPASSESAASVESTGSAENTGSTETDNTSQTSSEAVESTSASEENAPLPEGAEIILSYEVGNSWGEGSKKNCTVEMSLQNASSTPINGWELVLEVNGLTGAEGWNGTFTVSGGKLTIKNAEHNKNIALGEKAYFGGTMSFSDKFEIQKATLNGVECAVQKTRVNQNEQNNQQAGGEGSATVDPAVLLERSPSAKQGDDWLYTDGHRILDKDGKEVWLTGLNWFGYNTGTNLFDGLWNSKLEPTVVGIADHGFNLIRVPFSAELINQWAAGDYPRANYNNAYNPVLNDMNSLQIFDYFLKLAEENGIKVMIDIHSAETNASGHMANLWYTERVSVEDYYKALEWMADRYKNNDTIIAYDLKNEPHGKPNEGKQAAIWNDSNDANNWKKVAETAAGKVLAKNPNVLILVEGLEIYPKNSNGDYSSADSEDYYFNWWGGNLRAVADFPIDLGKYQNKLVYSPHDYGPTVYEQPWFKGDYTYDSLMKDCWHDNWLYIQEEDIAPLLIGEWGGFMRDPNLKWMTYMRQLIGTYHLNHTFWCLNANSGDTGGLLLDDFTTWDTEKYNFVKEVLWQESGKFVGLDHEIPLGKNGITLSDAKGLK